MRLTAKRLTTAGIAEFAKLGTASIHPARFFGWLFFAGMSFGFVEAVRLYLESGRTWHAMAASVAALVAFLIAHLVLIRGAGAFGPSTKPQVGVWYIAKTTILGIVYFLLISLAGALGVFAAMLATGLVLFPS